MTFIDCEARQGGAIYVDASELVFSYINLSFVNVKADDGAAIWLRNKNAPKTLLKNIFVENCKATLSSILNFDSVNILLRNLTINNSLGRSLYIHNSTLELINSSVINHECTNSNDQGCFAFSEKISVINVVNLYFLNVVSNFIEDAFSISNTEISLNNISILNYSTKANTLMITASESSILLQDSLLSNLEKSLIQVTKTEVQILNCIFINITSNTSYGIIYINYGLNVLIKNSTFTMISGKLGGCISLLGGSSNYEYNITNITVTNCKSEKGAGLFVSDQNIRIMNSDFVSNVVNDAGGCIYFESSYDNDYQWLIFSSHFQDNRAMQGGAYHSMRYIPKYENSTFVNNFAIYGKDFSGFPLKLSLEINKTIIDCDKSPASCYLRQGITSGQVLPPITISILDYYGQKMILLDGLGFLNLESMVIDDISNITSLGYKILKENAAPIQEDLVFKGVDTQKLLNGSFTFSEAIIHSQPPSNAWLKVKTDLIPKFYSDHLESDSFFDKKDGTTQNYYFHFKVYFRECISGEVYANDKTECFVCPKGKYSFFTTDKICKTCPTTAQCEGGAQLIVKPGYWRPSLISDDVYLCNILTESCLGGINSSCLNGYAGVVCGACENTKNKQFFKKGLFYCEECGNKWIYIIIVVIAMLIIIGFIFFLISSRKGASIENYVLVKIVTNHFQTVSFMANIKIDFPKLLNGFYSMQAPATSFDSVVFTVECFRDQIGLTNFETKLILSVIFPFTFVVGVIFVYIFYGIYKKKSRQFIFESIINALVVIGSFFQPPFINFYVQNLSCDKIGNTSFLTYNLEQECWDQKHTYYSLFITFPFLIFWMIIFPMIFFIYMAKNRKRLENPNVKQLVRFFLAGYKEKAFFWEFVQMSRKFLVILLTTFLRNNPKSVVYILIPVISFYVILQIIVVPYNESVYEYNLLEILSLNSCFITYYSAVFYLRVFGDVARTFFLSIIVISNGIFLFFWVKKYLFLLKGRITHFFSSLSLRSRISSKTTEKKHLKSLDDPEIKLKIKLKQ